MVCSLPYSCTQSWIITSKRNVKSQPTALSKPEQTGLYWLCNNTTTVCKTSILYTTSVFTELLHSSSSPPTVLGWSYHWGVHQRQRLQQVLALIVGRGRSTQDEPGKQKVNAEPQIHDQSQRPQLEQNLAGIFGFYTQLTLFVQSWVIGARFPRWLKGHCSVYFGLISIIYQSSVFTLGGVSEAFSSWARWDSTFEPSNLLLLNPKKLLRALWLADDS